MVSSHCSGVTALIKRSTRLLRSFKVWNCSPDIWSLRWPQRKKSKGFKSGLCDAHVFSVNLLMTRPSKWSVSHVKTRLAVWGAAPSCMNHCWPLASWPQNRPNARQKRVSTFIYRSAVTVSVAPSSLQNQKGPITPCALKASKHIHISISCNSLRCPVFVTEPKRSNNSLCTQSE